MKVKYAPLGDLGANFYMVIDDEVKEMFVVDPGECAETAIEMINDCNCKLRYIIITHAHGDHIGALDKLKETFNAPVIICKHEEKALSDDKLNLCPVLGVSSPASKADITVEHNDTLPFGKSTLTFIHTPGHTKGSMCIYVDNFLLTGDTLFNLSVGRCDFPGGSFEELYASVKNRIYCLNPETVVYPGHGNPTTIAYEMKNNPYVRG